MGISVFASDHDKVWQYRYLAEIEVTHQSGAVPNDPSVITGWLKSRLAIDKRAVKDEELAALVERTAHERGVPFEEAIEHTGINVNGFKRDRDGLYFEGRCVKSMLKEAFSVALAGGHIPARGWGSTNKGLLSFVAEHVQIPDDVIPLLREDGSRYTKADGIDQRFVSTWRGQGISYTERLDLAIMEVVVESDFDFTDDVWRTVWLVAEKLGIGAMRSQGSGKFVVTKWERLGPSGKSAAVKTMPKKLPAKKATSTKRGTKRSVA